MNPADMKDLADLLRQVPGIRSIDLKDVDRLVELLRDSPEVGSIEVKGWFGTGVVVTRTGSGHSNGPAPVYHAAPAQVSAPAGAPADTPAAPKGAGSGLKEIKSPMVGTFYMAPEPGAEPYAKVGTRVSAGQTVCIIEAMKIMNEIEAEISGVIREISVSDAHPVEFGQVLFRVDPNG
jgi:acetyl-CoA carboxylase biotin carboxyl carrier protein